jgi:hypothetical protein
MDVILFTSKFVEATIPAFQNAAYRGFKEISDFWVQHFTPVLCDKDYM